MWIALGAMPMVGHAGRARAAVNRGQLNALARQLMRHRIVLQAVTNLGRWGMGEALTRLLLDSPGVQAMIQRQRSRSEVLGELSTQLTAAGVEFMVLRAGIQALYPDGMCGDDDCIDVLVRDEQCLWVATAVLKRVGYYVRSYPWSGVVGDHKTTGGEMMLSRGNGEAVKLNLLCGRFPISLATCLDLDLFDQAREVEVDGVRLSALL